MKNIIEAFQNAKTIKIKQFVNSHQVTHDDGVIVFGEGIIYDMQPGEVKLFKVVEVISEKIY